MAERGARLRDRLKVGGGSGKGGGGRKKRMGRKGMKREEKGEDERKELWRERKGKGGKHGK
jgi:hypothetical protein